MTIFSRKGAALTAAAFTVLSISKTSAHEDYLPSPLGHAPIGVMGDHRHNEGDWMVSYRFMTMTMEDNRNGTTDLSPAQVRTQFGFPVVPLKMTTDMHMFGLMYGWSNDLTLTIMAPYVEKSMDHQRPNGTIFEAGAKGWGDIKVSGLQKLTDTTHLKIGMSLPTGSINERDTVPGHLPYPMQLGSGTYDILAGVTWTDFIDPLGPNTKVGAQLDAVLRTGTNSNDYRLGNQVKVTGFVNHLLSDTISVTGRITGRATGQVRGADRKILARPAPTTDPDNHGGEWVDLGIGLNYVLPGTPLKGHRISVEYEKTVYQDLNGPQLKMDDMLTIGFQAAF
ncbi:MAG: transporter [Alphaproteobacteria bacterium]